MGKKAFFLDFEFNTGNTTLLPRPETELLVEKAVELFSGKKCFVLDVGTGSGNIAISLTKYLALSRIVALDISDSALRIAAENAERLEVADRVEFISSDLFKGIRGHRYQNFFDLIISNPPYVSRADFPSLPASVKDDPYIALYGGKDGLDFYRKITREAGVFLKINGVLLMEIGYGQAESVKEILTSSGNFCDIEFFKDYSDIDRVVKAVNGKISN